jgi:hypothetical protein
MVRCGAPASTVGEQATTVCDQGARTSFCAATQAPTVNRTKYTLAGVLSSLEVVDRELDDDGFAEDIGALRRRLERIGMDGLERERGGGGVGRNPDQNAEQG